MKAALALLALALAACSPFETAPLSQPLTTPGQRNYWKQYPDWRPIRNTILPGQTIHDPSTFALYVPTGTCFLISPQWRATSATPVPPELCQ